MVPKIFGVDTPRQYYESLVMSVVSAPARSIEHLAKALLKGIYYGWYDCKESFCDWKGIVSPTLGIHSKYDYKLFRAIYLDPFFNLLGAPLKDGDSYEAPWDEFLAMQRQEQLIDAIVQGAMP